METAPYGLAGAATRHRKIRARIGRFRHEETDYTWAGRRGPPFAGPHANSLDRLAALAFDDRLTRSRPMSVGGGASHT
jgi:hypothetical protein